MKPLIEIGQAIVRKGPARTGEGKRPTSALHGVKSSAPTIGQDLWIGKTPGAAELVKRSSAARQVEAVIARNQGLKTPFHNPLATAEGRERLISDLLAVLFDHHPYSVGHLQRVREYSRMLGEAVDLRGGELHRLELGAVLHDIGKTAVPKSILQKNGPLNEREFTIMAHHPAIGADYLLNKVKELGPILSIIRSHHERPAGGGYPQNLKGGQIDPLAKIVSVVDAFDAMTSARSYRPALEPMKAFERLRVAGQQGQLDKKLVETFIKTFSMKKAGKVIPVGERFQETFVAAST